MLHGNLDGSPVEGTPARKPFIDHHTQCVLVARWLWLALQLFGRQVRRGSGHRRVHRLRLSRKGGWPEHGQAKDTEQHPTTSAQQHVPRPYVPMHEALVVSVL